MGFDSIEGMGGVGGVKREGCVTALLSNMAPQYNAQPWLVLLNVHGTALELSKYRKFEGQTLLEVEAGDELVGRR